MRIFGVSFDDQDANRAFAEKYQFNFPLLCDVDRAIGLAYGACDTPTAGGARRISYLIDAEGKVELAFEKVDARNHPATLLESL